MPRVLADLLILAQPGQHPHALDIQAFNNLFTANKPVVVNFHGFVVDKERMMRGPDIDLMVTAV
jgi:phosphoketolase